MCWHTAAVVTTLCRGGKRLPACCVRRRPPLVRRVGENMASIEKRTDSTGSVAYRVKVRLKGQPAPAAQHSTG